MDSSPTDESQALTDSTYWKNFWDVSGVHIRPSRGGVRDHVRESLMSAVGSVVEPSSRWIEIGCASSSFLLDVPTQLDAELDGVDISAAALRTTADDLAKLGVKPRLSCHDFATPDPEEVKSYDGVLSFGFVEHFADIASTLVSMAGYVRPGGRIVTVVPNMAGLNGFLQLGLSSDTFLTHHVITPPILRQEMERAGLSVERCEPLMSFNTGVVNLGERRSRKSGRALEAVLVGTSRAVWAAERLVGRDLAPRLWRAPYIISVGRVA
jgi:2-polyprenyl-3-methyl-5-hydroxy-6-metoxy-1,4-benzoquinol methylase